MIAELLQAYREACAGAAVSAARRCAASSTRVPGTDKTLGFDMRDPSGPKLPDGLSRRRAWATWDSPAPPSGWTSNGASVSSCSPAASTPPAKTPAIRAFRPAIHDAVMCALGAAA
ncbi:MAG: hypothetical protein MZV70_50530 [Desulfobacterales bacterium]|nr:hypothetical protein [Desulfobacterales bacterium]